MKQPDPECPDFPSLREVQRVVPRDCLDRSLPRSLAFAAMSLALTLLCGGAALLFLPVETAFLPAWTLYAVVCGTIATGCWVIAHECGHSAFCSSRRIQTAIGYIFHSFLLVPYFSWQRSHSVHHFHTNHLTLGETHVPSPVGTPAANRWFRAKELLGDDAFALFNVSFHLLLGWPLYLFFGVSGGPARGVTNHFWPFKPNSADLFPAKTRTRVLLSNLGLVGVLLLLALWIAHSGWWTVMALYGGPYLVVNGWLVLYTWLQHTDEDIPHLDGENWTRSRGAFLTVDRPYGRLLDLLHHRIGSTHVAHHINSRIPHYHAARATAAIREAFPEHYRWDPTPIPRALFRVARNCLAVREQDQRWVFSPRNPSPSEQEPGSVQRPQDQGHL